MYFMQGAGQNTRLLFFMSFWSDEEGTGKRALATFASRWRIWSLATEITWVAPGAPV
jgi:hypothetical protein